MTIEHIGIIFVFEKVYQARLRSSGQVVAVKVQRPGVQAAIALDILILRYLAGLIRKAGKFNTDLQVKTIFFLIRKQLKYLVKSLILHAFPRV